MLPLITLSLFVASALAQGSSVYGSNPSFGGSYGGRNYFAEIAEAHSRIVALNENDLIIHNRLSGVGIKINLVNNFREMFENNTLPSIKASMAEQDARIANITAKLKELMVLFDEVDALKTQVDNLVGDLKEVRDTRVGLEGDLSNLENGDIMQGQGLAELAAQVGVQDDRLDDAEDKIAENAEFAELIYNNTIQVVDVVNRERAEVFTVALDSTNRTVSQQFATAFQNVPFASWGITEFSATENPDDDSAYPSDPYAEKDLESLYTHVDVTNDENGFTATLIDQSNKWIVDRIVIRVSFFYIDSSILNVH